MSTVSAPGGARPARVPFRVAAPLFAALGDETRLRLLVRLSSAGPWSSASLGAKEAVTRQAVAKHLEVLEDVGLVTSRREGRERLWALEPGRLADAHDYLARISREWDSALARLAAYVENDE